jgi:putative ABC transport system substrate-binding protein
MVTGFTNFEPDTGGKWLQILKELAPRIESVGVLLNPTLAANHEVARSVEAAAATLGVTTTRLPAEEGAAIENAIAALAGGRRAGIVVLPNPTNTLHQKQIIEAAAQRRLPAVYPFPYYARNGGLVAYGVDLREIFRQAATYVDRILRGAKPADLPVQQPAIYELVINRRTARALGLTVPGALLVRANEVLE